MTINPTIETALKTAQAQLQNHSDSAWLDAEVLLAYCLNKPRSFLKAWPEKPLEPDTYQHFQQLIKQRSQQHPVAYLTGSKEFWSREFTVSPDVLVPRADTERLIELSIQRIPKQGRILDLGTGSGIIAITLGLERPDTRIIATDTSEAALSIARQNASRHQAKHIEFIQSDWFDRVPPLKFDLIVSNPPYIAADDPHLQQGDVQHEPQTALIATQNGLADIEHIAQQAPDYLKPGGWLLIEHGYDQQAPVQTQFNNAKFNLIETYRDLAGNPRVTAGQWKPL